MNKSIMYGDYKNTGRDALGYNQSRTKGAKMNDKPKRLQKLEDYWSLRPIDVWFEYEDFDEWTVYMKGYFDAAEVSEIAKALKAVNKAGRL